MMADGSSRYIHRLSVDAPRHVAIIMDGNGRWAAARGLPRHEGHRRGVEALRRTVRAAGDFGIEFLTVYAFSTENWSRPATEVSGLMGLLKLFIRRDLAELHEANVRVRIIGDRDNLAPDILRLLIEAETLTRLNTGTTLTIAFNYGGRQELVRAMRAIAARIAAGDLRAEEIDIDSVGECLDTSGLPDPDLVIRTSGEQRVSNFLLWQAAYAEYVFSPVLWPDFDKQHLEAALHDFQRRDRRFGGLTQTVAVSAVG